MRYFLSLLISATICFTAFGQGKTNFALAVKMQEGNVSKEEAVSMLLQGDVAVIRSLVNEVGGHVKHFSERVVSVRLSLNQLSKIITSSSITRVEAYPAKIHSLSDSTLYNSNVIPVHNGEAPLVSELDGTGVVIGIIDTSIEFEHPDFKDAFGNTRVHWIWDQKSAVAANTPSAYGYGQEWSKATIDSGLCTHSPGTWDTHGTHVTGLAAGNGLATGNYKGMAPNADIIFVALDFSSPATVIADAVAYIFEKSAGKPCVINASLGSDFGFHDGKDLESQLIDDLIHQAPGRAMVAAVGNSGAALAHVEYEATSDTAFTLFSPINGAIYLYLVADSSDLLNVNLSIGADKIDPEHSFRGNTPFQNVANMPMQTLVTTPLLNNGNQIGVIQSYLDSLNGNYALQYLVVPDSLDYQWRLMSTGSGRFDLWNYDQATGYYASIVNAGDLTLSPNYKHPDTDKTIEGGFQCLEDVIAVTSYINRQSYPTCSGQIYADSTKVAGALGYDAAIMSNRSYSFKPSKGPTRDGRMKPDIAAPGDITLAASEESFRVAAAGAGNSVLAGGCYHVRDFKTSHASPLIAGIVALYLQENPTSTAKEVREALVNNAVADEFTGADLPNTEWGYGKANAFAMLTGIKDSVSSLYNVEVCEGDSISFSIIATGNNLSYQWQIDVGEGFADLMNDDIHSNVTTNRLVVMKPIDTSTVINYRCKVLNSRASKPMYSNSAKLIVNQSPQVTFSGLNTVYCEGAADVVLLGNPSGGVFQGEGIIDSFAGIFSPSTAGEGVYSVSYNVRDVNNCRDTFSLQTSVLSTLADTCSDKGGTSSPQLGSPVFTPNGDAYNPNFSFKLIAESLFSPPITTVIDYRVEVYDRSSRLVFYSTNIDEVWDGSRSGGQVAPEGTYYYVVSVNGRAARGFISLIR